MQAEMPQTRYTPASSSDSLDHNFVSTEWTVQTWHKVNHFCTKQMVSTFFVYETIPRFSLFPEKERSWDNRIP